MNVSIDSTKTRPNEHKFYTFLLAGPIQGATFSAGHNILWCFSRFLQGGVIGWREPCGRLVY